MSVGALVTISSLQSGDQVKGQFDFTDYYPGYGFFGQLTTLTTDAMYAVKLANAATLTITGTPVSVPKAISLNAGWTWIANPYQTNKALNDFMPPHSGGYVQSDQIKSQFTFSEYYGSYGWFGTLNSFEPGVGYRLKVANSGVATFN